MLARIWKVKQKEIEDLYTFRSKDREMLQPPMEKVEKAFLQAASYGQERADSFRGCSAIVLGEDFFGTGNSLINLETNNTMNLYTGA
jgi:hypothetical protein